MVVTTTLRMSAALLTLTMTSISPSICLSISLATNEVAAAGMMRVPGGTLDQPAGQGGRPGRTADEGKISGASGTAAAHRSSRPSAAPPAPPRDVTRGHRLPAATRCAARRVSHIAGGTALVPLISVEVGRGVITCGENGREEQARRPPSLNQSAAAQKCHRPLQLYLGEPDLIDHGSNQRASRLLYRRLPFFLRRTSQMAMTMARLLLASCVAG